MWAPGYWNKRYWAGRYWPLPDSGSSDDADDWNIVAVSISHTDRSETIVSPHQNLSRKTPAS